MIFARSGIVGKVLCVYVLCRNREDQLSGARLLQSRSDMKEGRARGKEGNEGIIVQVQGRAQFTS